MQILEHVEVALEPGAMGEPDQGAMKRLPLPEDRRAVPEDLACLEGQHSGNRPHQAGLATAIAALQQ